MDTIELISLRAIKPNPRNARTHSKKQIGQIAYSIKAFGFLVPLLIDETSTTLGGHGRIEAAKLLGLEKVPVIRVEGLSEAQKRALMLADNKIAANAGWDRERLASELPALAELLVEDNLDITITGFGTAEIDQLILDFDERSDDPADEIESSWLSDQAITQSGDLWQLGSQRLLCGDARRTDDLDRLLGVIGSHDVDWLGLEMLFAEQQPMLDRFNGSAGGTPEHHAGRAELIEYFAEAWNGRAGPKVPGEENLYFKAVEEAHRLGIRVVALEGASVAYLLFRYGEAPFGGSVRSYQWANHTPDAGRGIIFGGSAHFNSAGSGNVQDYLATMAPGRTFVSLRDLKAPRGD